MFASTATIEILLEDLLEGTLAHITRAISVMFGIVDPKLREEYKWTAQNIRHIRRVDTIEDEIFHLRAILCNVMTHSHMDTKDWKNGLVWTTPFGPFEGKIPQSLLCYKHRQIRRAICVFELWV